MPRKSELLQNNKNMTDNKRVSPTYMLETRPTRTSTSSRIPTSSTTATSRSTVRTSDAIMGTIVIMNRNEQIYKFIINELAWSGWGGTEGKKGLVNNYKAYMETIRDHKRNYRTVLQWAKNLNELNTCPLIREKETQFFLDACKKNKALLEITQECQDIIIYKKLHGFIIPKCTNLKIFLEFPELQVSSTSNRVPLYVLCQSILRHYDLHNDKEFHHMHQFLTQEVELINYIQKHLKPDNEASPVVDAPSRPKLPSYTEFQNGLGTTVERKTDPRSRSYLPSYTSFMNGLGQEFDDPYDADNPTKHIPDPHRSSSAICILESNVQPKAMISIELTTLESTNGSSLLDTNGSSLLDTNGSSLLDTNGSSLLDTNGSSLLDTNISSPDIQSSPENPIDKEIELAELISFIQKHLKPDNVASPVVECTNGSSLLDTNIPSPDIQSSPVKPRESYSPNRERTESGGYKHLTSMERWNPIADTYDALKAGSIDGTDVDPHDRAILRAMQAKYKPNKNIVGNPEHTVFIGRLSVNTDEEMLENHFAEYGKIKKLRLVRNIVTGISNGYGFIEYFDKDGVYQAQKYGDKSILDEKEIYVDYECERTLKGWIPRRLGGGICGRKESGQLRFGGKNRPFKRPYNIQNMLKPEGNTFRDRLDVVESDRKPNTDYKRHGGNRYEPSTRYDTSSSASSRYDTGSSASHNRGHIEGQRNRRRSRSRDRYTRDRHRRSRSTDRHKRSRSNDRRSRSRSRDRSSRRR